MEGRLEERIERVIEKRVNPKLAEHQGYAILTGINDGVVGIRLDGECAGCLMAQITIDDVVKKELMEAFPNEIKDVVLDNGIEDMLSVLEQTLGRKIDI